MAKKRTEKKTKTFSEAIGLQYIFNNTITDFFIGLALVVIAVVIIIAMISFLNTGANDQSLLENLKPGEWTNTEKQFQNYCGSWRTHDVLQILHDKESVLSARIECEAWHDRCDELGKGYRHP